MVQGKKNNDNLFQTKRIHVAFVAESKIKSILQTKQITIISLFQMGYLLLQYNISFNLSFNLH